MRHTGNERVRAARDGRRVAGLRVAGLRVAAVAATVALGACNRGDAASADSAAAAAPQAVTVGAENVAIVRDDTLATGPAVSGTLAAEQQAQVRAEAPGTVLRVSAEAGQRVPQGALLAQIEQQASGDVVASAEAGVSAAESSRVLAERELQRSETLFRAGAIAERDVETARRALDAATSQLANARAQLASARQQLSGTRATAPFAGIVSERAVNEGDVVAPGAAMFTIVDPSTMRYEASVPAAQLAQVRVGAPVRFAVSGYPGRSFEGRVTRVNPVADPTTRQVRILVSVPNEGGTLVGGLFAEGRVASDRRAALVAPASALDERGVTPVVYRLKGGVVERVPVQVVLRDAQSELVGLEGGLAAGDTLLTGAAQGITPGTPVRVGAAADTTQGARPVGGQR